MPTNTHIMTMKQLTIWVGTDPGASAGSERLLARFPQKSAVNTAGSNMTTMARMKAKMGTSLQTMTMALSAMKPMPVMGQAMSAGPGAAVAEMSVERAKTPEPIEELMTSAMRPIRLMPRVLPAG